MNDITIEAYMLKLKELEFLSKKIDKLTKERNMFRTQAMMRMNKIKELEGILNENRKSN